MENRYELFHVFVKESGLNRKKLDATVKFLESTGDLVFLTISCTMSTVITEDESLKDLCYSELINLEGTLDGSGNLKVTVCDWLQITALCKPAAWESIKALKLW